MFLKSDDFKTARRWNAFNRFLQVVLGILFFCALNYLASQVDVHHRWDITPGRQQSLSLETQENLATIARFAPKDTAPANPWVCIYLTLSPDDWRKEEKKAYFAGVVRRQLQTLLDDFQFVAAKSRPEAWLRIEKNSNLFRAELENKYSGMDSQTVLVITCKDRYKIVSKTDLFESANTFFKGEEILVSALLNITSDHQQIAYLTTGHGEKSPANRDRDGISSFAQKLEARNISLRPLDLTKVNEVPADAELLLIVSPQTAFLPAETEKLRDYARKRNGRIFVFVDPGTDARLDSLFYDWGILVDDALVLDKSHEAQDSVNGGLFATFANVDHDLTRLLADRGRLAVGLARPVRFDLGGPTDATLKVIELVRTVSDPALAWGERSYRVQRPQAYKFDDIDVPPPVSVVAAAERAAGIGMNLRVTNGGRLLVCGSSHAATNAVIDGNNDNATFLLNTVNWMLERKQFLNITPRPLPEFQLRATSTDLERVAWRFAWVPAIVLLFGLAVSFWRRIA